MSIEDRIELLRVLGKLWLATLVILGFVLQGSVLPEIPGMEAIAGAVTGYYFSEALRQVRNANPGTER